MISNKDLKALHILPRNVLDFIGNPDKPDRAHRFQEDNISQKENITDVSNTAHVSRLSDRKARDPGVSDEISSPESEIRT